MNVQRFVLIGDGRMSPAENFSASDQWSSYVLHSDYLTLLAENEALRARWEELRPLLGMMAGGDDYADAVRAIREASDAHFQQACKNGGSAQEQRERAEAAEAEVARLRARIAEAPVAAIQGHDEWGDECPMIDCPDGLEVGQRVRLLVEPTPDDASGGGDG